MKNTMQQSTDSSEVSKIARRFSFSRRSAVRAVLPVLLVAGSVLIFCLPAFREQFGHIHEISAYLRSLGWAAPLIFIPAVAVLVAVGVPRLLLCPIGGMAFGFWQGLLWAQLGTMLGYYATFLFVRWSGRDFILRTWPRLSRYTRFSRKNGMISVLLIRQLPITGFYLNLLLGLIPLSHADFLLGTVIGILPAAVPATLVGSGATAFSSGDSKPYTLLAIVAGIVLWVLAGRFLAAFLKNKRAEKAQAPVAPVAASIPASE
ncbi:MAG: VTT domain-containing protein [Proteobacteria bacterium]|nr:VTT domain-containing protein [Pseudomonadota bacterium]